MSGRIRSADPRVRALTRQIADAGDPQIMRIVATIDAMFSRGPADNLIAPLRQRLAQLRPPRPLRFARLLFHPLDPLIVPAVRWRPGNGTIPRTALMPVADYVQRIMGAAATSIEAAIAGQTNANTGLIARLGRWLWPAADEPLSAIDVPMEWQKTQLGDPAYRKLAPIIAALLAQAPALDLLCERTANGLLPPDPESVTAILMSVRGKCPVALPMIMTLLLTRLPKSMAVVDRMRGGPDDSTFHAALEQATDRILGLLIEDDGTEARLATGSLADAGAAVGQIASLLTQLESTDVSPERRRQLVAVRQRLDIGCQARFVSGLEDDLLMPLQALGSPSDATDITSLEAAARGLRVLEHEGRRIGSGALYDLMLEKASEAIKGTAMRDRLTGADQVRLVEILSGPDAALSLLSSQET